MAMVKEYTDGNCKIYGYDDSVKSPEEVKKIIERVSRIVLNEEFKRVMEERKKEGLA